MTPIKRMIRLLVVPFVLAWSFTAPAAAEDPGIIDLEQLDGGRGFTIVGPPGDPQGYGFAQSLGGAGDLDGDGLDDLFVSAYLFDTPGARRAGAVYALFGQESFDAIVDLTELDGTNGFVVHGEPLEFSNAGRSVAGVGDVNGDGLPDFAVGAHMLDVGPNLEDSNYGRAYIVYGRPVWPALLELSQLDESTGFRFTGNKQSARVGTGVAGVGDVNADGYADVLVSSERFNPTDDGTRGQAYLLFGGPQIPFDLSQADLDGERGVLIDEAERLAFLGRSISGDGDVDGDGISDLVVGTFHEDDGSRTDTGEASVLFGRVEWPQTIFTTEQLDGVNGFNLRGAVEFGDLGGAVGLTDWNGDGFADLLAGADSVRIGDFAAAGEAYVVFGGQSFPPAPRTNALDGTNGFTITKTPLKLGRNLGNRMAGLGDVNADGFGDLAVSTVENLGESSEVYVLLGRGVTPATVDTTDLDGTNGYTLTAFQQGGGTETASLAGAGDLDGDGFPDVLLGSTAAFIEGGAAYVVLGRALSGMTLTVTGECPGTVTRTTKGLTPNGRFGLVRSSSIGNSELPAGPCAGTRTDLNAPILQTSGLAGPDGTISQLLTVGPERCEDFFQVIDARTCRVSNPAPIQPN